jgi:flagellar hook-associated protein 1 FlgK
MSLSSTLSIATHSLASSTAVMQEISNNISNANTPGYNREVAVFRSVPADTSLVGSQPGLGADLVEFQSVRNQLLQSQIQSETQAQGQSDALATALQQIQPFFTTSTQDIGTEMSNFFNSLSSLSTDPGNSALRQSVLATGNNLAKAFNMVSHNLTSQQFGFNSQVTQDVGDINQLVPQIAALNPQIAMAKSQGQDPSTLLSQQDQLLLQ